MPVLVFGGPLRRRNAGLRCGIAIRSGRSRRLVEGTCGEIGTCLPTGRSGWEPWTRKRPFPNAPRSLPLPRIGATLRRLRTPSRCRPWPAASAILPGGPVAVEPALPWRLSRLPPGKPCATCRGTAALPALPADAERATGSWRPASRGTAPGWHRRPQAGHTCHRSPASSEALCGSTTAAEPPPRRRPWRPRNGGPSPREPATCPHLSFFRISPDSGRYAEECPRNLDLSTALSGRTFGS